MIVSLWWAYFPFVQSTCSIKCSAAMRSLQQDRWQFAHHQLYPTLVSGLKPPKNIFLAAYVRCKSSSLTVQTDLGGGGGGSCCCCKTTAV